ncbi:VOC family protein [Wenzhouxiangella marina]|uniref:Biphenyl-2,3-diol 1,2-dioxygenase 2 n=1 Tax=Wenzhouxiangella marina TaxID=1579979 RepID=A0A0K0XU52_9GAMM|nr:VOC family protein [Wenzhouxiangella marina]AKS41198.1 Biphenyl-2,3-diol 1,2-dioxygenase 2 [Wenzhouxiangella marina]MBB6088077.1 catechol 2,3-dioxygenase-like lactoylglutathione lyase family enzyme [Wenzhouxiangella marina]
MTETSRIDSGPSATPRALAHVVYRTRRFEQQLDWYGEVFGARVQHRNPAMAFLTFDDEHHRFAFLDLSVVDPDGEEPSTRSWVGIDHLAWTFASLDDLFENYRRCRAAGIEPYWCVHHGLTISMYYADPDGNQMEFQVNAFDTDEACNRYICGPAFELNPVGVEFDPEAWLAAVAQGASLDDFRERKQHEPVSPIRGAVSALL